MSDTVGDGPPSFDYVERRCRICRDADLRRFIDELLDWRGVSIPQGRGKSYRLTYAKILRTVEHLNIALDGKDRITYNSLWVHANRHYGPAGIVSYCRRGGVIRDFINALSEKKSKVPTVFL